MFEPHLLLDRTHTQRITTHQYLARSARGGAAHAARRAAADKDAAATAKAAATKAEVAAAVLFTSGGYFGDGRALCGR
ncbi:hypothetical protein ABZ942_42225 [Nocardia sp. NPDC046473]|uniref:hypothetical protein n=1 Tax=Nocardia sp. NPDC046473 TaxID=3155733 RepID=UPI0033EB5216